MTLGIAKAEDSSNFQAATPLLIYGSEPLTVNRLKKAFGEATVTQSKSAPGTWIVKKKMWLTVWYDFFSYEENDRGDLVEMTGFFSGSCDNVLDAFFNAIQPIQNGNRGPLLSKVSMGSIIVEHQQDGPGFQNYGGQIVKVEFRNWTNSAPCTLTHQIMRR
jgi:hypothetical protein